MSQFDLNKRYAKERGYKVVTSPFGSVAMDRKAKWFTPAFKKEEEAWIEVFKYLNLPTNASKFTQEFCMGFDFGNEED